ncbi:MAG: hypothetical protein WC947_09580 [Elusimicrobiota bacterium]
MILINLDGFQPGADWIKKSISLKKQLIAAAKKSDWDKVHSIIDKNGKMWQILKQPLLDLKKYRGKCWYSESKNDYAYMHVDHFRPKKAAVGIDKKDYGGYWWLAFEWKNYRICGPIGNVNKRDKFAVYKNKANCPKDNIEDEIIYFLDPTEEQDVLKITFNNNGEIMPIHKSGFHFQQAVYTIDCLKLNDKPLKEARKEIWIKCDALIRETQYLTEEDSQNPSSFKKGQIKEKIKQLQRLVISTAEFSATAKACLRSTGIEWAMSIAP